MATKSNCVAEVEVFLTKAIKRGNTDQLKPSQWARKAGFEDSAASPLRRIIARVSGNGCGRNGRYREMTAEELLDLIHMGQAHQQAEEAKKETSAKRIRGKLYPATRSGAKQAKTGAKRGTRGKAKA